MEGDALRTHLDMLLLAAVDDGAAYGYGLIQHLSERTQGATSLAQGTVYMALHPLWRAGHLARATQRVAAGSVWCTG